MTSVKNVNLGGLINGYQTLTFHLANEEIEDSECMALFKNNNTSNTLLENNKTKYLYNKKIYDNVSEEILMDGLSNNSKLEAIKNTALFNMSVLCSKFEGKLTINANLENIDAYYIKQCQNKIIGYKHFEVSANPVCYQHNENLKSITSEDILNTVETKVNQVVSKGEQGTPKDDRADIVNLAMSLNENILKHLDNLKTYEETLTTMVDQDEPDISLVFIADMSNTIIPTMVTFDDNDDPVSLNFIDWDRGRYLLSLCYNSVSRLLKTKVGSANTKLILVFPSVKLVDEQKDVLYYMEESKTVLYIDSLIALNEYIKPNICTTDYNDISEECFISEYNYSSIPIEASPNNKSLSNILKNYFLPYANNNNDRKIHALIKT